MSRRRTGDRTDDLRTPLIAHLWRIDIRDDGRGEKEIRGAFGNRGYPLMESDASRVAQAASLVRNEIADAFKRYPRTPTGPSGQTEISPTILRRLLSAWLKKLGFRAWNTPQADWPRMSLAVIEDDQWINQKPRENILNVEDRMRAYVALDLLWRVNRRDWHLLKVCPLKDCRQRVFEGNATAIRCPRCQERHRLKEKRAKAARASHAF